MKNVLQTSKVKTYEGVSNPGGHIHKMRACSKWVHVRTRGCVGRIEKSVIISARTKWMASNKCHGAFFLHWSGTENFFVSFNHNTACAPVLSYGIIMVIRIYSIKPIYLQVSKAAGLAELHCVIGLSLLEKIISICFERK